MSSFIVKRMEYHIVGIEGQTKLFQDTGRVSQNLPHVLKRGATFTQSFIRFKILLNQELLLKIPLSFNTLHPSQSNSATVYCVQLLSYVLDCLKALTRSSIFGNFPVYVTLLVKKYIKNLFLLSL